MPKLNYSSSCFFFVFSVLPPWLIHTIRQHAIVYAPYPLFYSNNHGEARVIGRNNISECVPKKSYPCKSSHGTCRTPLICHCAQCAMVVGRKYCGSADKTDLNVTFVFNTLAIVMCSHQIVALSVWQWGFHPSHVKCCQNSMS